MKKAELSIGDWVRDKYMHTNFQIFQIDGNTVNHAPHSDSGFLITEIEPVLITPKILEKNGFEAFYYTEQTCYRLIGVGYTVRAIQPRNNKHMYLNEIRNDCLGRPSLNSARLEYVHELQHALRLCKIDKEIKL